MNDMTIVLMLAAIGIVGLILLVIIIFTKHPGSRQLPKDRYRERWLKITNNLADNPASLQMAIMEADKLLDMALKEKGVSGTTMGERMKQAKDMFSDRNGVWAAHKLRNQLAHEDNVKLDMRRTKIALDKFRGALKDMGAL